VIIPPPPNALSSGVIQRKGFGAKCQFFSSPPMDVSEGINWSPKQISIQIKEGGKMPVSRGGSGPLIF